MRTLTTQELGFVAGASGRKGTYHAGSPSSPGTVTSGEQAKCNLAKGMATSANGAAAGNKVYAACMKEAKAG